MLMHKKKKQDVSTTIPVITFREGDKVIAYSPAFDLCTFGSDEEHAKKRFNEAVTIFLQECMKMGTLEEVLEECGWHRLKDKTDWIAPVVSSIRQEKVKIPCLD
jgi:hypothetical protein